jgi:hypothetical protein
MRGNSSYTLIEPKKRREKKKKKERKNYASQSAGLGK